MFDINVDYTSKPNKLFEIQPCYTYTGDSSDTGMIVLEVGLPTGFNADVNSLNALVGSGTSKFAFTRIHT